VVCIFAFWLNYFVFADQHNKPSQNQLSDLKEDIMSATIATIAETEADLGYQFLFTLYCMEVKTMDLAKYTFKCRKKTIHNIHSSQKPWAKHIPSPI